ncbi:hypothetical protein TRICI_006864 [Trichomonascus ciferrii]|uniref:Kynurenine formamidase n=1 Tax=Trichomonascus ciferrii TaxID=44093 RepID=A0A642UC19_9ASCO|nr:hypothetical protein TRICI_006864 [Trichomonascus ciferrii]
MKVIGDKTLGKSAPVSVPHPMQLNKYNSDPLQQLAVYNATREPSTWVIYIHGGAWRDPKMDHMDGDPLLKSLRVPGASIDYRLSPQVHHPEHLKDVLEGLGYLERTYSISRCILVGHSAGAFLSLQSVMFADQYDADAAKLLSERCDTIIGVEGIYNLRDLELENPSYADFVTNAFGSDRDSWDEASPASGKYSLNGDKKLIIVHSSEDELLNHIQPQTVERNLKNANIIRIDTTGKHDEVPKSNHLLEIVNNCIQ